MFAPIVMAELTRSLTISGKVMDFDYKVTARKLGIVINRVAGDDLDSFPIERARIRSLWYFIAAGISAQIVFGWAVETRTNIALALAMLVVCGVSFTAVFNVSRPDPADARTHYAEGLVQKFAKRTSQTCLTLNVDLHPNETGLASVAASLTRCLAAAAGVAALQPLFDSVGLGWTFTILGFLSGLSIPMLLTLRIRGPSWRNCEVR